VDSSSPLIGAAPTRLYLAKRRKRMKVLVDDLRAVQKSMGYPSLYVESLSEIEIQNDLHTLQVGLFCNRFVLCSKESNISLL
jgi:hypothetical protein